MVRNIFRVQFYIFVPKNPVRIQTSFLLSAHIELYPQQHWFHLSLFLFLDTFIYSKKFVWWWIYGHIWHNGFFVFSFFHTKCLFLLKVLCWWTKIYVCCQYMTKNAFDLDFLVLVYLYKEKKIWTKLLEETVGR